MPAKREGDIRTGDVEGNGIAIGHGARASAGQPADDSRPGRPSRRVAVAGALFFLAIAVAGVLLALDMVSVEVAGFLIAALGAAIAAVPLLRG